MMLLHKKKHYDGILKGQKIISDYTTDNTNGQNKKMLLYTGKRTKH